MVEQSSGQWAQMEIRLLAALQAIAREGSFHGAASRLGYTQSTVSEQIAALERITGQRLVERPGGPRRVSLTEAGRLLLAHADAVIARLQAAEADIHAFRRGERGLLRVGTYQSAGRQIVPPLLQEFGARWPRVEVILTESADDADFFPLIENGELDLAFVIYPLLDGPFAAVQLVTDPYVLVVPADSTAARDPHIGLTALAGTPLIAFRQGRSAEPVEAHLRARGIEPRVVFRSDDYGTVEALVATGIGVALVPALTVSKPDPRVAVIPLNDDLPPRRLGLAWHRHRTPSPAMQAFLTAAQLVAGGLPGNAGATE